MGKGTCQQYQQLICLEEWFMADQYGCFFIVISKPSTSICHLFCHGPSLKGFCGKGFLFITYAFNRDYNMP